MDYSTEKNGSVLVVRPRGSLNAHTAPELEEALQPELDGVSELVVDLSEVKSITSMGLRVLLSLLRRMEKQGVMRVENACGNVAETFEMTGFSAIF